MQEGVLVLKREKNTYQAGFSVIRESLTDLSGRRSILHTSEINYFETLKYDRRKLSYLLGRISAKKAIGKINTDQDPASLFIDFGIFSFPVVKFCRQNIQVSITHCDDIGITLAFPEEHPLGIDIEKVNPDKINAIQSQIGVDELRLIDKAGLLLLPGCIMIWTIKEGLSKIFRTGMMMDFQLLEIASLEKEGFVFVSAFKNCGQYKGISCYSGDYICSVIVPKNTTVILDELWQAFINVTSKQL